MTHGLIVTHEISFNPPPELAKPIVIVSEAMMEMLLDVLIKIDAITEIKNEEDFAHVAKLMNEASKIRNVIEETRLNFGRPFRAEDKRIKSESDKAVVPADARIKKCAYALGAWNQKVELERQAAMREQQRLADEAALREKQALAKLDAAKGPKSFENAGVLFDTSQEVKQKAAEVFIPPVPKAKGVAGRPDVEILSSDVRLLPLAYHMVDEKKLRAHILDGTITEETPGVKFRKFVNFHGTGR